MMMQYTPVSPEIVDILHKASTYEDKDGSIPAVNDVIPATKIKIGNFSNAKDAIWNIAIKDPVIYEKMQGHIIMMQWNEESVLILSS